MENVLIGGTGFIGKVLSRRLVQDGEEVISLSRTGEGVIPGVRYVKCAIPADVDILTSLLKNSDNIYILTGQSGPGFSFEKEMNNLRLIVEIIRESPVKRVFYTSSATVYGDTDKMVDEQSVCHPVEEYAQFKLEAERLLQNTLSTKILTILRLGNVYGAPGSRGIIGLIIENWLTSNSNKLRINGDGSQKRDYIFIDDVIEAMMAIKQNKNTSDVVNIVSGTSTALRDVILLISNLIGREISYETTNVWPNEIRNILVSNKRLGSKYGYTPNVSLEMGLKTMIKRYQERAS